jgi:hypothetical protein
VSATVTHLTLAPVKGMRVTPAEELDLGPTGAHGDRSSSSTPTRRCS